MASKQQKLARKANKRKEHNKALRLEREQKAIEARRAKREIRSVGEFTSGFVKDALGLIQYREQFTNSIRSLVKNIELLKEKEPAKYANLSIDQFNVLIEKIAATDEQFKTLGVKAAEVESAESVSDKMTKCMDGVTALSEAQVAILDIADEFSLIEASTKAMLSGEKSVPEEIDTPETTEFEDVEPVKETEELKPLVG